MQQADSVDRITGCVRHGRIIVWKQWKLFVEDPSAIRPGGTYTISKTRTHARTHKHKSTPIHTHPHGHAYSLTRTHASTHTHTQIYNPRTWLQRMRLHFSKFDLESGSSCTYDRVKIYDGSSASAQLKGSYCGSNTPADVESSGSTMFVSFTSDYSVTQSGFEIRYSLGESTLM